MLICSPASFLRDAGRTRSSSTWRCERSGACMHACRQAVRDAACDHFLAHPCHHARARMATRIDAAALLGCHAHRRRCGQGRWGLPHARATFLSPRPRPRLRRPLGRPMRRAARSTLRSACWGPAGPTSSGSRARGLAGSGTAASWIWAAQRAASALRSARWEGQGGGGAGLEWPRPVCDAAHSWRLHRQRQTSLVRATVCGEAMLYGTH
jgi:hypothetical protein